jgi:hypothetical protein
MCDPTILAVTGDESWLARLQRCLKAVGAVRLIVTRSMEEAVDLLDAAAPDLIVVRGEDAAVSHDDMDDLLWVNSTLSHPARLLVTGDNYEPQRAVTLFQMGVDEYLGLAEQRDKLPVVLCRLLSSPEPTALGPEAFGPAARMFRRASRSPLLISAAAPA